MGRNNKPKGFRREKDEDLEPLDLIRVRKGVLKTEIKNGVEFSVQANTGTNLDGEKQWTCPFCNLMFGVGVSHVVVWEAATGPEKRRHFHNVCWKKFQGRLF